MHKLNFNIKILKTLILRDHVNKILYAYLILNVVQSTFASDVKIPRIVLNKISNNSAHDLILTDRVSGQSMQIAASQQVTLESEVKKSKNIVILGSMIDCMKKDAQFTFQAANPKQGHFLGQATYMNVCAVPGGIDDGSRITAGVLGAVVVKYLMASSLKGCNMDYRSLKKQPCGVVKVDLFLTSRSQDVEEGVFRIEGSVELHEE